MEIGACDNLGRTEIVFVGSLALGLGFGQLWSINRDICRDEEMALTKDVASDRDFK